MGSCCSRTANEPEPNSQPAGRVLGSSSTGAGGGSQSQVGHSKRAPAPSSTHFRRQSNFKTPGRTLGGEEPRSSGDGEDARQKAAGAAQVSFYTSFLSFFYNRYIKEKAD